MGSSCQQQEIVEDFSKDITAMIRFFTCLFVLGFLFVLIACDYRSFTTAKKVENTLGKYESSSFNCGKKTCDCGCVDGDTCRCLSIPISCEEPEIVKKSECCCGVNCICCSGCCCCATTANKNK